MHIDCGGIAQELVNGRKVKIALPSPGCGTPEHHLRNVLFVDELSNRFGYVFSGAPNHNRAHVFREANVRIQGPLVLFAVILPHIGIDDEEFRVHGLRHPRAARDQILGRRIRTDAHRDTLADRYRGAIFFQHFTALFEAQVDRLRHLAERQFAKRNQIRLPKKILESPPDTVPGIDISPPHSNS